MPGPSAEDCQQLLNRIVERIEHCPMKERTQLVYCERNTLFYAWILQTLADSVEIDKLIGIVGTSISAATRLFLNDLLFDGYIRLAHNKRSFRLIDDLYNILTNVLNEAQYHWYISSLPSIYEELNDQVTNNIELIGAIIEEVQFKPLLVDVVAHAIKRALGNTIQVTRIQDVDELASLRVKRDIVDSSRLLSCEFWAFTLCVYPSSVALTTELTEHISNNLHRIRITLHTNNQTKYNAIDALFATTAIDKEEDMEQFGSAEKIHYLWAFSLIRFLNLLDNLSHEFPPAAIRKHFPSIFVKQETRAFEARRAIANLRSSIENAPAEPIQKKKR